MRDQGSGHLVAPKAHLGECGNAHQCERPLVVTVDTGDEGERAVGYGLWALGQEDEHVGCEDECASGA